MPRATVTMVVLLLTVGPSCAQARANSADSPRAPLASAPSSLHPCPFEVGDIVRRAGGGAAVPPPGQGVVGNFDGTEKSGSIHIDTSTDGLVTITSRVTGQPKLVEACQLADA